MAFYTDGVVPWNSLDDNTRAPLSSELEGGYPCGEADQQLFNWTAGWPIGNIWNMLLQSGITPDPDKLLDLARAIQSGKVNYVEGGGTANALTATLSPAPLALAPGLVVRLKPALTNTAKGPTLNVNGLGAKTIVYADGGGVSDGELVSGGIAELVYDGTNFVLSNPWTAILRLSPRGARQTRAFTPGVALTDVTYNAETVAQTITVTGTAYLDCVAYVAFRNQDSALGNIIGYMKLLQGATVISTSDYLGCVNNNSLQTSITLRERFFGLNPALTYTVQLIVVKQTAVGPYNVADPRILALHE
ncbi:hypothetical protein [Agrobacterium tumefaciens]|uniref:Uncharacterized protein n=1 Tax=Agrobacterium tumefaciens TaxID=358 RepID=A0A2L2LBV7_AGRTU|nr:hypothetical protein [Agrobacterium tumefaciens]AVH41807.1 hypothetical protein At1D1609_17530 [Agrobacterium tumefaciens]NSY95727.1 hypothetical protein [Agrobacterium tumefaciens]